LSTAQYTLDEDCSSKLEANQQAILLAKELKDFCHLIKTVFSLAFFSKFYQQFCFPINLEEKVEELLDQYRIMLFIELFNLTSL
jgi:hypothetical protein